jgi:hypothetical protein
MRASKEHLRWAFQLKKATKSAYRFCCSMERILSSLTTADARHTSWQRSRTVMESLKYWRTTLKVGFEEIFDFFLNSSSSTGDNHPNLQLKSPDKSHEKLILQPSPNNPQNLNLLTANNMVSHGHGHHATTSTQSSNFYENTMHSDTSSAKKRKSVISSQSTGSSNEVNIDTLPM